MKKVKYLFIHVALWIACLIAIFPILRVVTISLRPGSRLLSPNLSLIPADATFENYVRVLTEKPFLQWLYNSLIITVSTGIFGVCLAATAAYAFSRYKFPGRKSGLLFFMMAQMVPATMLLLPIFLIMVKANLLNTYAGIILANSVTALPFSVWILKGYFDSIPRSLEEAARVDGCSELGAFYKVILPLSTPALAIAFLFNFTQAWNEYIVAATVLQSPVLRTWPLGLYEMQGNFSSEWGMFAAGSALISVPVICFFLYSSKYMLRGLTLGSVKG